MLAAGIFSGSAICAGDAGNVLRGDVREQMILVGPLRDRSVSLQAAMGDHGSAVQAFGDDLGFGRMPCPDRPAFELLLSDSAECRPPVAA